jgi:hypothetical protein
MLAVHSIARLHALLVMTMVRDRNPSLQAACAALTPLRLQSMFVTVTMRIVVGAGGRCPAYLGCVGLVL